MAARLDIERRLEPSVLWQFLSVAIALLVSLIVCAFLLTSAGADVLVAFSAIYDGAFGSWKATLKTLIKASPLILTGEVFGLHYRLTPEVSLGFGFTGIIIAMLAGLHPIAVVFVAILFGALINGGIKMQIVTGVPSAIISAIEAIILLFFLAAAVLNRYQFRLISKDE